MSYFACVTTNLRHFSAKYYDVYMKKWILILLPFLWSNSALALSCRPGSDPAYVRCDAQGCQPIFAVKQEISGALCDRSPSGFYDQHEFQSIISDFQKEGLLGKEIGLFEIALSTTCSSKRRLQNERSKAELNYSTQNGSQKEDLKYLDARISREHAFCLESKMTKIQTDNIDDTISALHWKWRFRILVSYLKEPGLFFALLAFLEAIRRFAKRRKRPLLFSALAQLAIIFSVLSIVFLVIAAWVPARWFLYPIILIAYGTIVPRLTKLSNSDNVII